MKICKPIPNDGFAEWPTQEARCASCRVTLHMVPMGDDDWKWVDAGGNTTGNADDAPLLYLQDPAAWWAKLRELMASKDEHASSRAAQTYSTTQAHMDICGIEPWKHPHRPDRAVPAAPGRTPPDCCELPMHAQPGGWACRATGHRVPYETP